MIGEQRLQWLRQLPAEHRLGELVLVHAAPGDLWRAPAPDAEDAQLSAVYEPLDTATAIYGHIHRPYARSPKPGLTVANSGCGGMPWDKDPRASYLLVEDGRPRILRVEYDVEQEDGAAPAQRLPGRASAGRDAPPWSVPQTRRDVGPAMTSPSDEPLQEGVLVDEVAPESAGFAACASDLSTTRRGERESVCGTV